MQIVPSRMPEPRLLSTAARQFPKPAATIDDLKGCWKLKRESLFTGNGGGIFVGIGAGAILLCGAGWLSERHHRLKQDELNVPRVLTVAIDSISDSPQSNTRPRPVVVQFDPELLRVTAIVLGHPRLAVINGRSVAEGENLVVHAPNMSVAVTLRIVKISDGYIELANGRQTITARLNVPSLARLKTGTK